MNVLRTKMVCSYSGNDFKVSYTNKNAKRLHFFFPPELKQTKEQQRLCFLITLPYKQRRKINIAITRLYRTRVNF